MGLPKPIRYSFAGFILDTGTRTLLRGDTPVPLTPKEFHALSLLVEAGGQAVPREFLVSSIWPDTVVGETSLGRIISVLRRHLGSESIVSIAKFGYRLVPPVAAVQQPVALPVIALPAVPLPTSEPAPVARAERQVGEAVTPQAAPASGETPTLDDSPFDAPVAAPLSPRRHRFPSGLVFGWGVAASMLLLALVEFGLHAHRRTLVTQSQSAQAAQHWDELGLQSLREGAYFRASTAFAQAVALEPHSALAHAHLADASLQLDQVDRARAELLLAAAPRAVRQLSGNDQRYLEAVRATAVADYPAATEQYRDILANLGPDSSADARSNALEDLGRALQREGKLEEARQRYVEAATLQPRNAGVQLHLGILHGLQHKQPAANASLDQADALYRATSDAEGLAEVSYQRGCMAYVSAAYDDAERFFGASLDLASRLADPHLKARALGALSTVERWNGKPAAALDYANREVQLGRDEDVPVAYADGVMHLANLAVARNDRDASRSLLAEALLLAQKTGSVRMVANAEFSTAEMAGRTGDFAQETSFAQRALAHYRDYGSVDGAYDARMLIIHGEAGQGSSTQAIADAQTLLADAERTHSDVFVEDTEEELGNLLTAQEDEPAALQHFARARELSHSTRSEEPLKALDVAGCLARLGRFGEAEAILAGVPQQALGDADTAPKALEVRILLAFGHGRYRQELQLARSAEAQALPPESAIEVAMLSVAAEQKLGQTAQALAEADRLNAMAGGNPQQRSRAALAGALVALRAHSAARALQQVRLVVAFFAGNGMHLSHWLALACEAEALHAVGDLAGSAAAIREAHEVMSRLQAQWPPEDFSSYTARPEMQAAMLSLAALDRPAPAGKV